MSRTDTRHKPVPTPPVTARGEATRQKLLLAAEKEFGERGYHNASISSITNTADVGLGTFYLYFRSKEDAYRELVRYMGVQLRGQLTEAIKDAKTMLDVERAGLFAFLTFVREHRNLYRLVQEALFIDEAIYKDYYSGYVEVYKEGLIHAQKKGHLSPGDNEARAWAIVGLGHSLGLRYGLWETAAPSPEAIESIADLLVHGLAPKA